MYTIYPFLQAICIKLCMLLLSFSSVPHSSTNSPLRFVAGLQNTDLHIKPHSPPSCYFLPSSSIHSPQHPVLKTSLLCVIPYLRDLVSNPYVTAIITVCISYSVCFQVAEKNAYSETKGRKCFPRLNQLLLCECDFDLSPIKVLEISTLSEDLLAGFILTFCPSFWWYLLMKRLKYFRPYTCIF